MCLLWWKFGTKGPSRRWGPARPAAVPDEHRQAWDCGVAILSRHMRDIALPDGYPVVCIAAASSTESLLQMPVLFLF
eukprot:scaffold61326_cov28-Tisochrysis_lutea.AAC.3